MQFAILTTTSQLVARVRGIGLVEAEEAGAGGQAHRRGLALWINRTPVELIGVVNVAARAPVVLVGVGDVGIDVPSLRLQYDLGTDSVGLELPLGTQACHPIV